MAAGALEALEADATAPDGQTFTLVTEVGSAEIHVPRPNKWRASARRALMDDSILDGDVQWARSVLSAEDYAAWMECDPTQDEAGEFIQAVFMAAGEDLESPSLYRFLEEHAEAVEADIAARYPSRSLKELFTGRMSYRELWVLIQRLPEDSWTQTALRDDPNRDELPQASPDDERFGPWGLINYQLAGLTNAVNSLGVVFARLNNNKDYKVEPVKTPGSKRFARKVADSAAVAAARKYLDDFNRGKG